MVTTVVAQVQAVTDLDLNAHTLVEKPADNHRRRWFGPPGTVVVDVALDGSGRATNLQEAAGRQWAARAGVATPEVLAAEPGGDWLVSRQAAVLPGPDAPQVLAAVELALVVQAGPVPDIAPGRTWRAPRRTAAVRAGRLVRARVPVGAFLSSRRAAAELPRDGIAHGDLHRGNLLSGMQGELLLVDWEFLAQAPVGTDALRLWATLDDPGHRALVLTRLLEVLPKQAYPGLVVLARWVALRSWAEAADEPDPAARRTALRRARTVLHEADVWL